MQQARYKTIYNKNMCNRIKKYTHPILLVFKRNTGTNDKKSVKLVSSVESGQDKVMLFRRNLLEQMITKPGSREFVENCQLEGKKYVEFFQDESPAFAL